MVVKNTILWVCSLYVPQEWCCTLLPQVACSLNLPSMGDQEAKQQWTWQTVLSLPSQCWYIFSNYQCYFRKNKVINVLKFSSLDPASSLASYLQIHSKAAQEEDSQLSETELSPELCQPLPLLLFAMFINSHGATQSSKHWNSSTSSHDSIAWGAVNPQWDWNGSVTKEENSSLIFYPSGATSSTRRSVHACVQTVGELPLAQIINPKFFFLAYKNLQSLALPPCMLPASSWHPAPTLHLPWNPHSSWRPEILPLIHFCLLLLLITSLFGCCFSDFQKLGKPPGALIVPHAFVMVGSLQWTLLHPIPAHVPSEDRDHVCLFHIVSLYPWYLAYSWLMVGDDKYL